MNPQYDKKRYDNNLGYRLLHVKGNHAGDSTLPYMHHSIDCMMVYFKSGEGVVKIEGKKYIIHEGDVLILNPNEIFRFNVNDKTYHERITLSLQAGIFDSFDRAENELFAPFYNRSKGIGNLIRKEQAVNFGIDRYFEEILENSKSHTPSSPLMAFCKIAELLSVISKNILPSDDESQFVFNPFIGEVIDYINLHFKEDIDISSVAENFNIDKSYLSHLFKKHVGISLWTYTIYRRIQTFNRIITEMDSVEDACYEAGFKNYSNFFRLYKKHMNMTPSEYKKELSKA